MTKQKYSIKLYTMLGRVYNALFQNRFSLLIYLYIIGLSTSFILRLDKDEFGSFFIYITICIMILTLTTVRLSNSIIYSRLTKHLSMNICSLNSYHQFDYIKERAQISKIFQDEFIEALESAHTKGYDTIRMTTHHWVYQQIVLNPRIQRLYTIKLKKKGYCKIPLEVLLLTSPSVLKTNAPEIYTLATRKRKQYTILMKAKR